MPEVSEVTLKAFFDSTWFKAVARIAMLLGAIGVGYVGGVLTTINNKVDGLEENIATVRKAQDTRDRDQIARDRDVITQRNNVNSDLDDIRKTVSVVSSRVGDLVEDVAEIKGILKQMNNTASARETLLPIANTKEN